MSSPFFPNVDPMQPVKPSFYPSSLPAQATPVQHTQNPKIVGTSVLGLKYKDGIVLAADNLASFGSLARFKDVQRIFTVGENTLIAYSGDVSDAQHIQYLLDTLMIRESHHQDDHLPNPLVLHNYLSRTMYNRRTKMDPLWNSLLIAGITPPSDSPMVTLPSTLAPQDATAPAKTAESIKEEETSGNKLEGSLFLGYVDLYGTTFSGPHIATGYAKYIALPLLRAFYASKMDDISQITKDEALNLARKCMEVLYYRDARSLNKFTLGIVSRTSGIEILRDQTCETDWSVGQKVRGYGAQVV